MQVPKISLRASTRHLLMVARSQRKSCRRRLCRGREVAAGTSRYALLQWEEVVATHRVMMWAGMKD